MDLCHARALLELPPAIVSYVTGEVVGMMLLRRLSYRCAERLKHNVEAAMPVPSCLALSGQRQQRFKGI
jgi:hypothetical protein